MALKKTHLICAIMATLVSHAYADNQKHHFEIPAQTLSSALQKLATQSGAAILFAEKTTAGKQSRQLIGDYSITAAVDKLLSGSGLTYKVAENGTVTIRVQDISTLKPVSVVAGRQYDETDPYNQEYVLPNSAIGTKTDTPIMETPLNIQVISKQVLKDQQVITLDQALKNVSGVTISNGNNNSTGSTNAEQYYLRGFATSTVFRNGFRMDNTNSLFGNGQQFANVESVEVLKGPAAILYGRVEPGGAINVTTKKPLATPYYSLNQQFGSYNMFRTSVDATGAINKDASLLYRVNGSYQSNNSFRELIDNDDKFIAPILQWNISDKTQAILEMEYQHNLSNDDYMILPFDDATKQFINLPHKRNFGERNLVATDSYFAGFNLTHQFNDNWSIKNQVNYKRSDVASHGVGALPMDVNLATRTVDRYTYGIQPQNNETIADILDVTGHFDTWGLKHTFLVGGDYYAYEYFQNLNFGGIDFTPSTVSLDKPIHSSTALLLDPTLRSVFGQHTDNFGAYIQDQIELPYDLHVLGGLRYQYVHSTISRGGADGVLKPDTFGLPQTDDAVTPRVGLLWKPQGWLSLYSNYIENFGANTGRFSYVPNTNFGKALSAETAQQWEIGAKTEFFDGRLRMSLAYYDLTKQNVATYDTLNPYPACGVGCYLSAGEVNSHGPEFDVTGEILPGWNVITTYANQDVHITKSTDLSGMIKVGNRMPFVPENTGSVWTTYELQQGLFKGVKFGGGVNIKDSVVNLDNSYKSVGATLVGLMSGYNIKLGKTKVTTQLNIDNLLDENYFTNASPIGNYGYVAFSTPRTYMGSINIEY